MLTAMRRWLFGDERPIEKWGATGEWRWWTLYEQAGYKYQRLREKEIDFASPDGRVRWCDEYYDHVYYGGGWREYVDRVVPVDRTDEYTGQHPPYSERPRTPRRTRDP